MTADIEQIKKKIIYRSNYRGTKEMDKLLGAFTNKYLEQLDYEDLNELIKLLEIDDNNLYNFYNGLDTNIEFEDNLSIHLLTDINIEYLKIGYDYSKTYSIKPISISNNQDGNVLEAKNIYKKLIQKNI